MSTNPSRYELLRGFLGGDDAGLSENAELGLLSLELVGQTAQFKLVARADDDAGLVTFLVEAPFACPADRRPDLTSSLSNKAIYYFPGRPDSGYVSSQRFMIGTSSEWTIRSTPDASGRYVWTDTTSASCPTDGYR